MLAQELGILDYVVALSPPLLVIFLSLYMLWAGRRRNYQIMMKTTETIKDSWKDVVKDLEEDKSQRSAVGTVIIGEPKGNAPLKNFLIVYALEDRHILLSSIIACVTQPNDVIAFEADPRTEPMADLYVIPRKQEYQIKKQSDYLVKLDDFRVGLSQLDDHYLIKTTSIGFARRLFHGDTRRPPAEKEKSKGVKKEELLYPTLLYALKDHLVRLSIVSSRKDRPHVKLFLKLNKNLDMKVVKQLFLLTCERINSMGKYDKKRKK